MTDSTRTAIQWRRCDTDPPPDGEVVMTKSPSGMVQSLKRSGHLWFVPDGSMYVYYTPGWWHPLGDESGSSPQ